MPDFLTAVTGIYGPDAVFLLTGLFVLVFGPILLFFGLRRMSNSESVATRLNAFVEEPVTIRSRNLEPVSVIEREISGSITSRVVAPKLKWLGAKLGRLTPTSSIQELNRQLTIAGNPHGLGAREFYGLRIASFIFGGVLAFFALSKGLEQNVLVMAVALLLLFFFLPTLWLRSAMRNRQKIIRRAFPDALDMLSVCSQAGLGFDQSLQRVSEHWDTPVGVEFGRLIHEMEMGLSRRDALRNMSERMDVSEVNSFVSFVLQTELLGLSISDTLVGQAEHMRMERRLRAQEQAQKIPSKMIIPMVFLIFPALLAMILGPVVPEMMGLFDTLGGR